MDRMDQLKPYSESSRPHCTGSNPGHDFRHIVRIAGRLDDLSVDLEPQPIAHELSPNLGDGLRVQAAV